MKTILIKTIPHSQQRYPTVGDWQELPTGESIIRVSEMGNEDYEFLVGLHELIEQYLCRKRGIPEPVVTAFDRAFETRREPGNDSEPGDSLNAPYRHEHEFATLIERCMAEQLGVNWEIYDRTVTNL